VEETTAISQVLSQFNLGNMPPEGSTHVGRFFWRLWTQAKQEKVDRLGMHDYWLNLHEQWRGKRKRRKTYPTISVNSLFKTAYTHCAALTERTPAVEVSCDDADPNQVQAVNKEAEGWWAETEQQFSLWASVQNMEVYGTTVEKMRLGVSYDAEGRVLEQVVETIIKDPFEFFPAPGFKMCAVQSLPFLCDAYLMDTWEVRQKYGIPGSVLVSADAEEQLFGQARETTRGGEQKRSGSSNLPSNYADVAGSSTNEALKDKALVVEIWAKDRSAVEQEAPGQETFAQDNWGDEVLDVAARDPMLPPAAEPAAPRSRFNYPDNIRRVVVCNGGDLVLEDGPNPNINWELAAVRAEKLLATMEPVPAIDPNTGQPVVDPASGQPVLQEDPMAPGQPLMQPVVADMQEALDTAEAEARKSHLWGKYPYIVIPALVDTSQFWGFSMLEMLEQKHGKIESLLTKLVAYYERCMFPTLVNPKGSGVDKNEFTNALGLIIEPNITHAPLIGYIQPPPMPQGMDNLLQTLMFMEDIISMTPEVTEGRRPKGVSAASAIALLQDKASTLFQPQIRNVDKLIRERGRMWISFQQQFGTREKPVKLDDESSYLLLGIAMLGQFDFQVESGSSAPITKAGRRQQYIELFKLNAMDLESLLEVLEIPNSKRVVERLTEQNSLKGAIQVLIQAGLDQETALRIYAFLMQGQFGTGPDGQQGQPPAAAAEQSAENAAQFAPPGGPGNVAQMMG
jgi:hypothetical protein